MNDDHNLSKIFGNAAKITDGTSAILLLHRIFQQMLRLNATILKFDQQGEKTGWSYISLTEQQVNSLKPGMRKSFRVKGKIDSCVIEQTAILPMGDGRFILPLNGAIRKAIGKQKGDTVKLELQPDERALELDSDFLACLAEDDAASKFFYKLPQGHRNYFSKWIGSARTDATKTKRIAQAINALSRKMGFPEMLRWEKTKKDDRF